MNPTSAGPDQGGLPPTALAFLKACQLFDDTTEPQGAASVWQQHRQWHVLQTGFDLGLQFLATWWAWRQTPHRPERLFYSVLTQQHWPSLAALESLPLPPALKALRTEWLATWRGMTPGTHRLVLAGGQVQLSLHSSPSNKLLRELDVTVDSVLLEPGFFAPPESAPLPPASPGQSLQTLSRLCRLGTRVFLVHGDGQHQGHNTNTSHNPSTKEWRQCGFQLDLADCPQDPSTTPQVTVATYAPTWAAAQPKPERQRIRHSAWSAERQALVVGAGLAGSAVAHSLALRGWQVSVIEQGRGVGAGASGLPAGLAAHHVSPDDSVLSRITRAGVRATLQRAGQCLLPGTDWAPTGVLEHRMEGKRGLPIGEAWPASAHEWSTHATAQQRAEAGLPAEAPALWHGLAGWIRPRQLVAAQLGSPGIRVLWDQKVQAIERQGAVWRVTDTAGQTLGQAPLLVVASGFDSLALLRHLPGFALPFNPLRGQISFGLMAELSPQQRALLPPYPVNGHGSFVSGVPTPEGPPGWYIGATFERQCEQAPVRPEDHAANQQRLATLLPRLGEAMQSQFDPAQVRGWAGLRCTLPDRLPAVGPLDSAHLPGLWVCAGMGARGISLAVLCGELTAAWLENEPLPLAPSLARHLAADRFIHT